MIRVGVAGWDYPDWEGIVYPAGAGRRFDRLAHLARYVDAVEVNSTFYRPVAPRVAASWLARTAGRSDFRFTAKAHRSWTHEPAPPSPAELASTLAGLRPLHEAHRLDALLLQFPQSFHFNPAALERLARLLGELEGWSPVVEVRHVSWGAPEAAAWFAERRLGWCVVDQPRVGRSTIRALARVTAPVAYLRLHGRNRAQWFRSGAGRDARYDYLYEEAELQALAGKVRQLAAQAPCVYVIQNNHFRGQAVVNALQMKSLLGDVRPAAPGELLRAYPGLAARVRAERPSLF
jgi:uncharacterized protein YecE (DUF72 family)